MTGTDAQTAYSDLLSAFKNGNVQNWMDRVLSGNYGGETVHRSTTYNNPYYGQTGGQSFGLGDQGFNDVFGNTSYSDGYHLDFQGNWVSNASGGSNNWGHGGGGGGTAHY